MDSSPEAEGAVRSGRLRWLAVVAAVAALGAALVWFSAWYDSRDVRAMERIFEECVTDAGHEIGPDFEILAGGGRPLAVSLAEVPVGVQEACFADLQLRFP